MLDEWLQIWEIWEYVSWCQNLSQWFFAYDDLSSRCNILTPSLGEEDPVSHHMSNQASEICKVKSIVILEQFYTCSVLLGGRQCSVMLLAWGCHKISIIFKTEETRHVAQYGFSKPPIIQLLPRREKKGGGGLTTDNNMNHLERKHVSWLKRNFGLYALP